MFAGEEVIGGGVSTAAKSDPQDFEDQRTIVSSAEGGWLV